MVAIEIVMTTLTTITMVMVVAVPFAMGAVTAMPTTLLVFMVVWW